MLGTPRMRLHEHDIWNYFDPGIGILPSPPVRSATGSFSNGF
jgi:hypothetical protein